MESGEKYERGDFVIPDIGIASEIRPTNDLNPRFLKL